ncbi:hypothetical protein HZB88_02105 [archaeon]|nr:hypothetical protein [archaeon]
MKNRKSKLRRNGKGIKRFAKPVFYILLAAGALYATAIFGRAVYNKAYNILQTKPAAQTAQLQGGQQEDISVFTAEDIREAIIEQLNKADKIVQETTNEYLYRTTFLDDEEIEKVAKIDFSKEYTELILATASAYASISQNGDIPSFYRKAKSKLDTMLTEDERNAFAKEEAYSTIEKLFHGDEKVMLSLKIHESLSPEHRYKLSFKEAQSLPLNDKKSLVREILKEAYLEEKPTIVDRLQYSIGTLAGFLNNTLEAIEKKPAEQTKENESKSDEKQEQTGGANESKQ